MPNYVTNFLEFHATDQQMHDILTAIQRDGDVYGSFDFNKIIPEPQGLDLTYGSITDIAIQAFLSQKRDELVQHPGHPGLFQEVRYYTEAAGKATANPFMKEPPKHMSRTEIELAADRQGLSVSELTNLGKRYLDNQIQHGATTWYPWRIRHWGTKWNLTAGSVVKEGSNTLEFDTAWSAPTPIVEALSQKFRGVRIDHAWVDENIGYNVGCMSYLAGKVIDEYVPEPGSAAAYELAFDILGAQPEDFSLRFDLATGEYVYDDSPEPEPLTSLDERIKSAKEKKTDYPVRFTVIQGNEKDHQDDQER